MHTKKPEAQTTVITEDSDDEPPDNEPARRIKSTEEEFEDEEFHESSDRMITQESTASTDSSGLRRSNRAWKPVVREGHVSYLTVEENNKDLTVDEALKSQNRDHWIQAMGRELKSLNANDTWEIVNKPDETTILNTKRIFKKKGTENGERRYKVRLVIQGCAQTKGINYEETFASVAKSQSEMIGRINVDDTGRSVY